MGVTVKGQVNQAEAVTGVPGTWRHQRPDSYCRNTCFETHNIERRARNKTRSVSGKKDEHQILIRRSGDVMRRWAEMWEDHLTMWSQHIVQTTYVGLMEPAKNAQAKLSIFNKIF